MSNDLPRGWKKRYRVWLQSQGRDRDELGYGVACLEGCRSNTGCGEFWITEFAADRTHGWEIAAEHERKVHTGRGAP